MTTTQLAELKAIADTLAVRSNDPDALHRFNIFVRSISSADRHELVDVLQTMITEARCVHDWQEQPGEPPIDTCSSCGAQRR